MARRQVIVWTNERLFTDAYMRHLASMSFNPWTTGTIDTEQDCG